MEQAALPLAALVIAAAALLQSSRFASDTRKESANKDYVDQLEKRVSACEEARADERKERAKLRDQLDAQAQENIELRVQIVELKTQRGASL